MLPQPQTAMAKLLKLVRQTVTDQLKLSLARRATHFATQARLLLMCLLVLRWAVLWMRRSLQVQKPAKHQPTVGG